MFEPGALRKQISIHRHFYAGLIALLVGLHGLLIIASTLFEQFIIHHHGHLNSLVIDIPLLIGVSLLYLSGQLKRRKKTAWLVTIMAYGFYLFTNLTELILRSPFHHISYNHLISGFILPFVILLLVLLFQSDFVVKSDIQGFRTASLIAALVVIAALAYGIAGFSLMDRSDFHQEISPLSAAHYTIDQFNITTSHPLHPYTLRAKLFVDSLSFVSLAAVIAIGLALFQPIRFRLGDQAAEREKVKQLLQAYPSHSEDFFKLWPHDKHYFLSSAGDSALAFHVKRGVAIVLGDPVGKGSSFDQLLDGFKSLCFSNDWLTGFIHTTGTYRSLFEKHDFSVQKLGEEAVVDISHFQDSVLAQKYFRQIKNKFERHGYSTEMLTPPHHQAIIDRLAEISKDWLSQGGHAERRFVMGYFNSAYMQQCQIMVARDAASTIQAFANLVPADFDKLEATYDMLRPSEQAMGNSTDYLVIKLIEWLAQHGYQKLNMGLCPLIGLQDEADQEKSLLIDSVMRFAYANGDRFFSFSGLHKFKAKYEPEWRDRYVVYSGGVRGFSRLMSSLMSVLKV